MAIAAAEQSQQSAELRQAFLAHLPKRLQALQRRLRRLVEGAFDINAFQLIVEDVQTLGGAAGRYGELETSQRLYALELKLLPIQDQQRVPTAEELAAIGALADALDATPVGAASPQPVPVGETGPVPVQGLIRAPAEYWQRWAQAGPAKRVSPLSDAVELPASAAPAAESPVSGRDASLDAAVQAFAAVEGLAPEQAQAEIDARTEAAAARRAAKRRVYALSRSQSGFLEALLARLEGLGCEVERFADRGELEEVLGSLVPDLVIVDAADIAALPSIGTKIAALRRRSEARVALVGLSEAGGIDERLAALRAGADAVLRLPIALDEGLARVADLLDIASDAPYRVLIVEDDRSQAVFAESILRKSGMETRIVMEPLATMQTLEDFKPDLILMDLHMPGCDGLELTSIIRERPDFVSTPIVFLSGEQRQEVRFDALAAGGDDFLAKPIRPKHLIAAVNNRLRRARMLHRQVHAQSPRDAGTGLYFRPWLLGRINELLASEQEASESCVLFVDVDDAAALRERLGLAGCDQLMRQLATVLAELLEGHGEGARYGDCSFLVLLAEVPAKTGVEFARGLRERIASQVFDTEAGGQVLSVSIGVCPLLPGRSDAAELLNASARSAQEARRTGRGVQQYVPVVASQGSEDDALLAILRAAVDDGNLQLLFQPLVAVDGSPQAQYQALLRMRGPAGRLVTAARIVPLAEAHGLMPAIDRWVLSRCLMVLDERQRRGQPVRLFVAQAASTLAETGLAHWLRQSLEARQLPADALVIELRQADVLARLRPMVAFCVAGHGAGLRFGLQGFEPGTTGLQLLRHLPIEFVKLHPDLVRAVGDGDEAARADLAELVAFANAHGRKLIAPQIEDARTAAALWGAGVHFIQGNFVQQPGGELEYDFGAGDS